MKDLGGGGGGGGVTARRGAMGGKGAIAPMMFIFACHAAQRSVIFHYHTPTP